MNKNALAVGVAGAADVDLAVVAGDDDDVVVVTVAVIVDGFTFN